MPIKTSFFTGCVSIYCSNSLCNGRAKGVKGSSNGASAVSYRAAHINTTRCIHRLFLYSPAANFRTDLDMNPHSPHYID